MMLVGIPSMANVGNVLAVSPLLTNLVSYWKMDEASGTRSDSHGSNHLTDNGSNSGLTGKIGNGAYFGGGASQFLTSASNSTLQVTGDFTFSIWVRVDDLTSTRYFLIKTDFATASDYAFSHDSTNGFTFSGLSVGSPATQYAWYHLVGWYDVGVSQYKLRVNDTTTYSSSTGQAAPAVTTFTFYIGGVNTFGTFAHVGFVDEVGFWKRELTGAEITQLYNSGSGVTYPTFT